MASMTIRNLDEAVLAALEAQAARKGVPVEEEARRVLGEGVAVSATPPAEIVEPAWQILQRIKDEIGGGIDFESVLPARRRYTEAEVQSILALGQRLPEPFDLKKFSDELADGSE